MPGLGNGFMDLSSLISDAEIALHEYAYLPQLGLEQFQSALHSLQEITHLNLSNDTFQLRLASLISIVDELVFSGSPYSSRYHAAFMSATDVLFQVAIGSQFGADRASQLIPLLSIECWSVLSSSVNVEKVVPTYVDYNAYLSSKVSAFNVGEQLASLASVGRVSFHLNSSKDMRLDGYFTLISVQSISWLKARFPELQWQVAIKESDADESLRDLCEQTFLPLFQHVFMQRDFRYRLLSAFESKFKELFYRKFGDFFSSEKSNIKQVGRTIPVPKNRNSVKIDSMEGSSGLLSRLPVRHGGVFYSGAIDLREDYSNVSYEERLGQDCLPSFLYEINTHGGHFVFDQAECIGLYSIALDDLSQITDEMYFVFESDFQARILFNVSACGSIEELFSLSSEQAVDVLIVEQADEYFALPYIAIQEVECICALMPKPRWWAKNIWLSKDNEPYLEPWLISVDRLSNGYSTLDDNVPNHSTKSGYYSGRVFDREFWIEAELFLTVAPYQVPFFFTGLTSEQLTPFIVYNGRCFDQVVIDDSIECQGYMEEGKYAFSAILEWMGETLVLPLDSCKWNESFPEVDCVKSFDVVSELTSVNSRRHFISSLHDEAVVIDKTNFLSFVGGLWPSALSLESDY